MASSDTNNTFSRKDLFIDLSGRVAIVTGAARGIGNAIANALTWCGAAVLMIDKLPIDDSIRKSENQNNLSMAIDVSRPVEVARAVDYCLHNLGTPDILIHAAGISAPCSIFEMSPDVWRETIDVNLHPAYYLTRSILPHMSSKKNGSLIFFSSMIAHTGGETSAHYTAAKSGVEGFVRSLAREVGPLGIRANVIAPGMIDTAMLDLMPSNQKEKLSRRIPMQRIGVPPDLIGITLLLSSDAASYITGQIIHINGGMHME